MKKFELTSEFKIDVFGKKLYRIKALIDFNDVKAGDLGGWLEKEENLGQSGNAWVYGNAEVYGRAMVYGDARVFDNALVCGNVNVYGNAIIYGNATVYDNAEICGNAEVYGNAMIYGGACIYGDASVRGEALISNNADYTTIKGFGTEFRTTTFFRCKDGMVRVKCGCFYGTIDEFRTQVKKTRSGKIAKEYLMIADLMEMHFQSE